VSDEAQEIGDLPPALLERIEHYFSTYKLVPDEPPKIAVTGRYGYAQAAAVIRASIDDYREMFSKQG
jgi:inorganic pyrophosphatase